MRDRPSGSRLPVHGAGPRRIVVVGAVCVALALLFSALLPAVPIMLGVLLVVAVALHVALPDLRPYLDPVLRVPVGRPRMRHGRLALAACAGVLLVAGGSVGATLGTEARVERERRRREQEQTEGQLEALLRDARDHLAAGNVGRAELALMDAAELGSGTSEQQREVERLLAALEGARGRAPLAGR